MNVIYDYMRPLKALFLKEWYDNPLCSRDDISSLTVENATILPLKKGEKTDILFGHGGVIDESGRYIPESGLEQRIWGGYECEDAEYRDETVVYCGYLVNQWGHFLVEATTRLWYLLHEECSVDKYVFILEENSSRQIKGNYREFLELLGVWEKIELITFPVKYKEVIIPEMAYKRFSHYSDYYKEIFEFVAQNALSCIEEKESNIEEKIYFSRSKLRKAKKYEFELDSMDSFFSQNNYRIVYPEELSLKELIHSLHHADVVATMSGSVQHNILFAPDGTKIQIFERFPINIDYQVQINMIKDLDVTYVDVCFPIYPTNLAGPLILGYTKQMKSFAYYYGYHLSVKRSVKKTRQTFAAYMKAYQGEYQFGWFSMDWYFPRYSAIYEGYLDSIEVFGDYLLGRKPFKISQCFNPQMLKHFVGYYLKQYKR